MAKFADMDHVDLQSELDSIRRRTKRDLACGAWRWLSVWAVLSAVFVVTLAVPPWRGVAETYWLIGVPVGIVGTVVADMSNRAADRRVRRREWPYWATAAAMTVAGNLASFVLPGAWPAVWLWVVFCGGFGMLLRLEGEDRQARGFWVLGAVFALLAFTSFDPIATSVVFGAVFVTALVWAVWSNLRAVGR